MLVPAKPRNACSRTHLVYILAVDSQASNCIQAVQKHSSYAIHTAIPARSSCQEPQQCSWHAMHPGCTCGTPATHLQCRQQTATKQLHSSASCTNTTQGEPAAAAKQCIQQLACNTGGASELFADKQLTRQAASAVRGPRHFITASTSDCAAASVRSSEPPGRQLL